MQFSTFFAFFAVVTLSVLAAPGITKAEHQRREMITRQNVGPPVCTFLGNPDIANGSTGCVSDTTGSGPDTIVMCNNGSPVTVKTCNIFEGCLSTKKPRCSIIDGHS